MKKINNPHDAIFKAIFSKKAVLQDFLTHRLTPDMLADLKLDTIAKEPKSYISEDLKQHFSDVVVRCEMKRGQGYLYFLLEHQSSSDPTMALRLLEYNVAIMRHHVDSLPKGEPKLLPTVWNFVIYSSKKPWQGPTSIAKAFLNPDKMLQSVRAPFLVDLSDQTFEQLFEQGHAGLPQALLKGAQSGDFPALLEREPRFVEQLNEADFAKTAVLYMINSSKLGADSILKKLTTLDHKKKKEIMTGLQRIEERGRQEGIQRGRQEGIYSLVKSGVIDQSQADQALKNLK